MFGANFKGLNDIITSQKISVLTVIDQKNTILMRFGHHSLSFQRYKRLYYKKAEKMAKISALLRSMANSIVSGYLLLPFLMD